VLFPQFGGVYLFDHRPGYCGIRSGRENDIWTQKVTSLQTEIKLWVKMSFWLLQEKCPFGISIFHFGYTQCNLCGVQPLPYAMMHANTCYICIW